MSLAAAIADTVTSLFKHSASAPWLDPVSEAPPVPEGNRVLVFEYRNARGECFEVVFNGAGNWLRYAWSGAGLHPLVFMPANGDRYRGSVAPPPAPAAPNPANEWHDARTTIPPATASYPYRTADGRIEHRHWGPDWGRYVEAGLAVPTFFEIPVHEGDQWTGAVPVALRVP